MLFLILIIPLVSCNSENNTVSKDPARAVSPMVEEVIVEDTNNNPTKEKVTKENTLSGDPVRAVSPVVEEVIVEDTNNNPLMLAIIDQNIDLATQIIEDKCNWLDTTNNNGETPLMQAVSLDLTNVVSALIKAGAKLDVVDANGNNAIARADQRGNKEITTALTKAGKEYLDNQWNFLVQAIDDNKPDQVLTIIKTLPVSYLDLVMLDGINALMYAAYYGHTNIAIALIKAGVKLDTKSLENNDYTALMLAARYGYIDIVSALIEAGADLNAKDKRLENALIKAENTAILKALIKAGADLNSKDKYSYTPLLELIRINRLDRAKVLIEAGANLDLTNRLGYTALILAADRGYLDIVNALIEAGADLNSKDTNSIQTALMLAVIKKHTDIAQALIKAGAD